MRAVPARMAIRNLLAHPVVRIALLALALRVFTAGVAFKANIVFPSKDPRPFTVLDQPHHFWDAFARWDSGWYRGIAMEGYRWREGGRSNLAFFPVYPLSMRYLGWALGGTQFHHYFAGIVVSWTAFVIAMVLLYKLARLDLDEKASLRAVTYCAVFPFAFFFGVIYAESLFLCLMVGTFYAVRTRKWAVAGIVGALAVCTRANGIMALPALAWLAWRHAAPTTSDRLAAVAALAAIVAGFGAWCGYNYALSGSPIEWMWSITRWGYHPGGPPWTMFARLIVSLATRPYEFLLQGGAPYDTLNGLTGLAFLLIIPAVWARLGAAYGLYMLANLLLPLSSGLPEGLGRYSAVLFPAFIWLGTFTRPTVQMPILFVFASLYALGLTQFVNVHPLY